MAKETSLFLFSNVSRMIEPTFSRCTNSKKARAFFQDFYPGKEHPKRIDQEFRNKNFWILNKRRSIKFFRVCGCCVYLASEKSHVDSAIQVHPIPKTMFFWVHMRFLWHKTGQRQNTLSVTLMVRCAKHMFGNFWSSHFGLRRPNIPFSRIKNPGKKHMTSFEFLQRPKVNSNITVPIKNMNNNVQRENL